ncbi:MAG: radical SAM protein [Candidatus Thermoplasmatota archaeon]|nr:radical SAM protein [Candidatus Thermoplasmatota archaeon]
MARKALKRYYEILDGEEEARYLTSKKVRLDVDLTCGDEELWLVHDTNVSGEAEVQRSTTLLDLKAELAGRTLRSCDLCERRCGVNRIAGEKGHCGVLEARVCSEFLHMGEEPELVPSYTIFFAGCTFKCVFCQNWDISTRPDAGTRIEPEELAEMVETRAGGDGRGRGGLRVRARNVNWVGGDPTSNLPFILDVLRHCDANLPQVWNSNMYVTEKTMRLLDGVIDIYLTDFKYGNDRCAERLSNAADYMRIMTRNHLLARRQAEMIIRHLVLPNHFKCCTEPALRWISENLRDVKVNVMGQYRPEHRAREHPDIDRPLRMDEYEAAIELAEELGLDLTD